MPDARPSAALRVAVNLIDLPTYRDRFRMLAEISRHVARVHLLTDGLPDDLAALASTYPRLRVHALGKPRFHQRAVALLERLHRAEAVDVIHDTFGHLSAFFQRVGPQEGRQIRLLTTQYTTVWGWYTRVRPTELMSSWRYGLIRTIGLWRDRRLCPMADRVVVLGPGHERDLIDGHGVRPERVSWLPSEIDTDTFTPGPHAMRAQGPLLLYTGTIFRNKGVDFLLRALSGLVGEWPELQLVMLGGVPDWERGWVEQIIAETGMGPHLHMPGKVPRHELLSWYRRADVYVFPSLFEGSPRSVREAVACGCRAVVSDIPGHRGIDPEGGFMRFAAVKDVAGWRAAIAELLAEPRAEAEARSERGAAWLHTHHSPAAVAGKLAQLYVEVMEAPPNTGRA